MPLEAKVPTFWEVDKNRAMTPFEMEHFEEIILPRNKVADSSGIDTSVALATVKVFRVRWIQG